MNSTPSCIPCYVKQALSALSEITDNKKEQFEILRKACSILPELDMNETPAGNSTLILWEISKITGVEDPFLKQKRYYNRIALEMYGSLKELVKISGDRFETAAKVAVIGNVIDLGILKEVNIEKSIDEAFEKGFKIDHLNYLKKDLEKSKRILYLGDNAGEILFDKILLEELLSLGKEVIFAVKDAPILNDATLEDAVEVGLDKITKVISTGSGRIGTDLKSCSQYFLDILSNSDIIISKGQGNFETLNHEKMNIYFILKAKCDEVANELGIELGDLALLNYRYL